MSTLKPEEKAMLKKNSESDAEFEKETPKVEETSEVDSQPSPEKVPLEILIDTYIKMRLELIKEMEARTDPVFLQLLKYVKAGMTSEEFHQAKIQVYAACNMLAMEQSTPVDRIAHLFVLDEPDQ